MSARQAGYEAYKNGKNLDDNPYEDSGGDHSDYAQWEEGWYDAEAEVLEDNNSSQDQVPVFALSSIPSSYGGCYCNNAGLILKHFYFATLVSREPLSGLQAVT